MNRRQLAFVVLLNAIISLAIALAVAWVIEMRRPDPEELLALYTPQPQPILAATPTPGSLSVAPPPTIAADAQPTPTLAAGGEDGEVYIVQAGDSLLSIALRYGLTVDDLVRANNLNNPDFVFSGQRLVIPAGGAGSAPSTASDQTNPPTGQGGVEINTIEAAGDLAGEAVLVVNESDAPINLQGWRVERENGPAYEFGPVTLFPGGSVRLYSSSGDDSSIALYWGRTEAVWSGGVVAQLVNPQDGVAHRYTVQ